MFKVTWTALLVFMLNCVCAAQPIIDVGPHQLLANTPDQTISVFVTGGDLVQAVNFAAQINDGGSAGGGDNTGPVFTGLDILTGTIFAPSNQGQIGTQSFPQLVIDSTITSDSNPTVSADGLLATLVLDTTGVWSGTYDLKLSGTLNGPTDFGTIQPTITNGTIEIVPEPASMILLGLGGFAVVRKNRR